MTRATESLPDTIPAVLMRGGTSKGVFLRSEMLPKKRADWDNFLLNLMGSPDPMQIDGLGGTHSSTSKVVLVERSQIEGVDIDYTFAQVMIDEPVVDWSGNCGNLTAAVGTYAVEQGLAPGLDPETTLILRNVNTGAFVQSRTATPGGIPAVDGAQRIDGVPNPGAAVFCEFLRPGGRHLGATLPLGAPVVPVAHRDRELAVSLVDVTHPVAFVAAEQVGVSGTETPAELNAQPEVLAALEGVRRSCAEAIDKALPELRVDITVANLPRLVLVLPGTRVGVDADVHVLAVSSGRVHHALPATSAACTGAASLLPGTVVAKRAGTPAAQRRLRIGHPKGVVEVSMTTDADGGLESVGLVRTARTLMQGIAFVWPSASRRAERSEGSQERE